MTARRGPGRIQRIVLLLAVLGLAVGGCRSVVPVPPPPADRGRAREAAPIEQRIVILVHGDASYLYHDSDGTAHEADVETLNEAFAAARALPQAEVFIFHQRPARRLLGLFPRDDGTMYHFRNGRLVQKETYDQDRTEPFSAEARRIEAYSAAGDSALFTAALYYGHALPERPRRGYHRSRPGMTFGIGGLARGLQRLSPPDGLFDAVVLSTCDGGTPPTLAALAPHARWVVASPGDLHLSFVDADLLAAAPTDSPEAWARSMAERAFDRLTARTVTAVSLATYDTGRAGPVARRLAQHAVPDTSTAPTGARHTDCRQVLDVPVDTTGVRVWYRPPRFGRQADQQRHSGWGCAQF